MARAFKPKIALNRLPVSPFKNPLLASDGIVTKRRWVKTRSGHDLLDPSTGEVSAVAAIHQVEVRDDAEFVKLFSEGVKAAFNLSRTGYRVFLALIEVYQQTAMKGGFAEAVELFWFGKGLAGRDIDMSEDTYKKGLRELLEKEFIALRQGNTFWVNPSLFFKGDRVAFIKEYRRMPRSARSDATTKILATEPNSPE